MTKILLVEDDDMNRDMISRQLKWERFHVILACDGLEAVQMAQSERPDIILMDMGLPILTGWQATARIKSLPELHAIPIIALTAFAMVEDRTKSLSAGCDAFETKPVDFPRLIALIHRLLARTNPVMATP